ncbi:uncharacterized protein [Henckelia pumila]|uniref:uncharacterized protein isoform X2 n=1 Tax=Henckelia pumila TaxID=405737 RepID=UPI003C6E8706
MSGQGKAIGSIRGRSKGSMSNKGKAIGSITGGSMRRGRMGWKSHRLQDDDVDLMLVNHRESEQNTGLNNIPCNETQDKEARRQSSENNISSDACNEDDNSSIVRRRGPNRGSQIPPNSDERTNIHVAMNKFIEIEVVRDITTDIKGSIKEAWPTWKKVPNDSKNLLWDNFKLRYKWDNLTDREMKKVWNENAGR